MKCRSILQATFWCAVMSILGVVTGAGLVVALGATVMAVEPIDPRDRAAPKIGATSDPLRITVLGTSLSSASRYRWPDEVGAQVSALLGRPVETTRITQPGATSEWGAEQVDRVIATDPDVVLIEFGVNDADARNFMTVERSAAWHEQIIAALTTDGQGPAIVLLTMNPATGPRAWLRPFLSRYYAGYVDLAARYNTGLVDLYARWIALPESEADTDDGLHPSDSAATRVIATPVADALAMAAAPHG